MNSQHHRVAGVWGDLAASKVSASGGKPGAVYLRLEAVLLHLAKITSRSSDRNGFRNPLDCPFSKDFCCPDCLDASVPNRDPDTI